MQSHCAPHPARRAAMGVGIIALVFAGFAAGTMTSLGQSDDSAEIGARCEYEPLSSRADSRGEDSRGADFRLADPRRLGPRYVQYHAASAGQAHAFESAASDADRKSGSATLKWQPPASDVEGQALAGLAGYRILYGSRPDSLTHAIELPSPSLTSVSIEELTAGTYYFAVAAYTADNMQSDISPIVSKTIR